VKSCNLHLRILSNCYNIRKTFTEKDVDDFRPVELVFWFKLHGI